MALVVRSAELYEEIFKSESIDNSTQARDTLYIDNASGTNITGQNDFTINADLKSHFIYLNEAYLEITPTWSGFLKTLAGPPVTTPAASAVLSNFGIFKRGTILINDNRVEDVQDLQIASTARALVENVREYNETVLSAGIMDTQKSDAVRGLIASGGKVYMPLSALFKSVEYMPMLYGCKITLNFTLNKTYDAIYSSDADAATTAPTFSLSDLRLAVPVYKPNEAQKLEIEAKLASGFEREFVYEHVFVNNPVLISAANTSPTETVAVSGGVPVRCYLVPVDNLNENARNNDRTDFALTNGINRLNLFYDNMRVLTKDIQSKPEAYKNYVDCLRKQTNEMGCGLSYQDYISNKNEVLCFDLSAQSQSLFDSNRSHDLKWDLQTSAPTRDFRLYTVAILQAKMKIRGENGQITIVKG